MSDQIARRHGVTRRPQQPRPRPRKNLKKGPQKWEMFGKFWSFPQQFKPSTEPIFFYKRGKSARKPLHFGVFPLFFWWEDDFDLQDFENWIQKSLDVTE